MEISLLLSYKWPYCLCCTLFIYVYSIFVYLARTSFDLPSTGCTACVFWGVCERKYSRNCRRSHSFWLFVATYFPRRFKTVWFKVTTADITIRWLARVLSSGISQPNAFQRSTRQSVVTYTQTLGFSRIVSTQRHHTMRHFTNLNRV